MTCPEHKSEGFYSKKDVLTPKKKDSWPKNEALHPKNEGLYLLNDGLEQNREASNPGTNVADTKKEALGTKIETLCP